MMKRIFPSLLMVAMVVAGSGAGARPGPTDQLCGDRAPLKLVQIIPLNDIRAGETYASQGQLAQEVQTSRMVNVGNHFDHFEVDLKRQRLFVTPEDHKRLAG